MLPLHAVASRLLCGASAFGYSGTIAHAVLGVGSGSEALGVGRVQDAPELLALESRGAEAAGGRAGASWSAAVAGCSSVKREPSPPLLYRRHAFQWRDPPHPFAQLRPAFSDSTVVFRSSAAGSLHTLVADHVVQGLSLIHI